MRLGGAGLIAAVLALAGCKGTGPKPADKDAAGTAASRAKQKDAKDAGAKGQTWLDGVDKLPGTGTRVPKAGTWAADPKSPGFDARAEAQDGVGGKVVDSFNRPARNVFIRVEALDGPAGAAATGIYTDQNGYFFTRGLKAGKAYNLTAEATHEGKPVAGSVQARVPNPVLTIVLRDDIGLPPGGTPTPKSDGAPAGTPGDPAGSSAFPPPPAPSDGDHLPPMGLDPLTKKSTPKPTDGAYSPGAGATSPVPATIGTPPGAASSPGEAIPQPDDLSGGPAKPPRPENVADGQKNPFAAPPVSIPGPPTLPPVFPAPLPGAAPPPDPKKLGARLAPGAGFALADTLDRPWDFAAHRSGSVVLVEFMTTTCVPCKQAIPVLSEVQARYGSAGLQVIAVACDELPQKQRAAAAGKYARDHNLNYAVYVEPGAAGIVRDRFGVEAYPTAVLLDSTGTVLWKGHPAKRAELEAAVKRALK